VLAPPAARTSGRCPLPVAPPGNLLQMDTKNLRKLTSPAAR
jgi:hypothetical protein